MAGVSTIKRGGSRYYVRPDTGDRYPGVTSIVGMVPKDFLGPWNAKMVAEEAVSNLGAVVNLAVAGNHKAAVDMLKGAARRYTTERAELGSQAHDLFERLVQGENPRVHPDLAPYADAFRSWLDKYQPEVLSAEQCAWSDEHKYAGSYDLIARIEGDVVIVDYKTGKSTYPDVALQLSAYAHADYILMPDGQTETLPKCDAGAVLHITTDPEDPKTVRAEFKPVDIRRPVFQDFVTLRRTFDWVNERSKSVLGNPVWTHGEMQTGTQRRG